MGGYTIGGGAVYSGAALDDTYGFQTEPALIDPRLAVDWADPDWQGESVGYWPTYEEITPQARAAYLSWLGNGRNQPGAHVGYVFLYFYGLERRALVECGGDPSDPEVVWAVQEVRRLLGLYGDSSSFEGYASGFLNLVETVSLRDAELAEPDWATLPATWDVPAVVRVGLSRYAVAQQPIPPKWALAFVRTHPEVYLRTAASRCTAEFDDLFCRRYTERYGAGMVIKANRTSISVTYRPASRGIGSLSYDLDGLPDVTVLKAPVNQLRAIAESCTDDLDAYSRFLGRNPDAAGTPAAAAFLPDELLTAFGGDAFAELRRWGATLAESGPLVSDIEAVVQVWSPGRTDKLAKRDATSLAALLAKVGVGIEPDVRFGGRTPAPGSKVVLFALPAGAPAAPSSEYAAAALLVHLTAVVAGADGNVDDGERAHLAEHLEATLGLDAAERARLDAGLHRLTLDGPTGLTGVKRRLESLDGAQRGVVGEFLVGVAAADGVVSPAEITTLTKVFKLLGLDAADVYSAVHHLGVAESGPVTVRRADIDEPRWSLPDQVSERPTVRLDPDKISARLAETASVAALLTSIFVDDSDPVAARPVATPVGPGAPPPPPTDVPVQSWSAPAASAPATGSGGPSIDGLDTDHVRLVVDLVARDEWSRSDFDDLVESMGLLPAGALDRINEAAMDLVDDLLLEGDDPLEVNRYAAKELLP